MGRLKLKNKRFGRWFVLGFVKTDGQRGAIWRCKCDCGTIRNVRGGSLMAGRSKSCGCLRDDVSRERCALPKSEAAFNAIFSRYKRQAKERNLEFLLSKEQFKKLTKKNCFYCNTSPTMVEKHPRMNGVYVYSGVDRVNNSIGYVIDNCVSCCWICNTMKRKLSQKEFFNHIEKIYNSHIKTPVSVEIVNNLG